MTGGGGRITAHAVVRRFLAVALAAASGVAFVPRGEATPPAPNIVLILTDDQRLETDLATGQRHFMELPDGTPVMPNVRSLIADPGVTFDNAFVVDALCCPSRATILTGKHSHSTGVYRDNAVSHGGFEAFDDSSTVATWLHDGGYWTALVGKYLNQYVDPAYTPPGWDRWVTFVSGDGNGAYYDYKLDVDGVVQTYLDGPEDYSTDVLAGHADDFIRSTPAGQPLFLYFSTRAPHEPATPAPRHESDFATQPRYRPPSFNEGDVTDKPAYVQALPSFDQQEQNGIDQFRLDQYRSLEAVDDAVGTIVQALADTGRLSDTLVVYSSDNGLTWGEHRWPQGKVVPYEESIRVPMVVRYDPLAVAGSADDHLVLNVDLAQTFADVAGVAAPGAEGASLVPLLTDPGGSVPWRTDFLVEHLGGGGDIPKYCAVRDQGYAYVAYDTTEEELYDLAIDPFQLDNRASDPGYQGVLEDHRDRMAVLCDPPPPPIGMAPVVESLPVGQPITVFGNLTYPLEGPLSGQILHIERTNPDGSTTPLPDRVSGLDGTFSFVDTPAPPGEFSYTASWDGDGQHDPVVETIPLSVTALTGLPDFNGDGFDDLAVGVPSEDVGGVQDAGAIQIFYGGPGGLTAETDQVWTQESPGIGGVAQTGDAFGSAVAAGDFDGDGYADVAVGTPRDDETGQADTGSVNLIFGSPGGLSADRNVLWTLLDINPFILPGPGDRLGTVLASGNFGGDGYADLAVGIPGRDVGGVPDAGGFVVVMGDDPFAPADDPVWSQDTPGVDDTAEPGDQFGSVLAAGDFDGDGYSDLAAGAPFEDLGTVGDAGAVDVLTGDAFGLVAADVLVTQDSPGVPDAAETGDRFGTSLSAGDFDQDGFSDLVVGSPQEDLGTLRDAGVATVVYGSASGPDLANSLLVSQDAPGVVETAERGDRFGWAVATGDVDDDGFDDLAAGVPTEDLSASPDAGGSNVILGGPNGLEPPGNRFLSQDSPAVDDHAEPNDRFAGSVMVLDLNGDGLGDLVVGSPFEDVGAIANAGGLNVVYGGGAGPLVTQDSPGVEESSEPGDTMALSLAPGPHQGPGPT